MYIGNIDQVSVTRERARKPGSLASGSDSNLGLDTASHSCCFFGMVLCEMGTSLLFYIITSLTSHGPLSLKRAHPTPPPLSYPVLRRRELSLPLGSETKGAHSRN